MPETESNLRVSADLGKGASMGSFKWGLGQMGLRARMGFFQVGWGLNHPDLLRVGQPLGSSPLAIRPSKVQQQHNTTHTGKKKASDLAPQHQCLDCLK